MITTLTSCALRDYVQKQLTALFPDGAGEAVPEEAVRGALARLEASIEAVADRNFWRDGHSHFNHLHSDQYAMFLYLLGNTVHRGGGPRPLCEKLFFLNKALYGIDAFYEVELPRIFLFCHAGGSVLGRATYSDYLLVYQHCTVGAARAEDGAGRGVYPVLGPHASLYAGASVLGASRLGDNCKIAAHSVLIDKDLPPNTAYRGTPQSFETTVRPLPDHVWRKPAEP